MYCRKCGKLLNNDASFCTACGIPTNHTVEAVVNMGGASYPASNTVESNPQAVPQYQKRPSNISAAKPVRKMKRSTLIAICTSVLVVVLAVVIPVVIESVNAQRYEAAFNIMRSNPLEAKAEFSALGNYSESAAQAEECQRIYDYSMAKSYKQAGDIKAALAAFQALGDYQSAREEALACQYTLDYEEAAAYMESGDIQKALDAFLKLGSFSDSELMAVQCQNSLDYDAAKLLMDAGKYADAADAFASLGSYSDSASLAADCANKRDYKLAGEYFNANQFYSAQRLYWLLGTYLDSAELAAACEQPMPKTGELYRLDSIKKLSHYRDSGYNIVTFSAPDDGKYTYIKIKYATTYTPAVSAILAPGKKIKIKLPADEHYIFEVAYGTVWYGEKEFFGENGTYITMMFNDSGSLSSWVYMTPTKHYGEYYVYTIKLRQEGYSDGEAVRWQDF